MPSLKIQVSLQASLKTRPNEPPKAKSENPGFEPLWGPRMLGLRRLYSTRNSSTSIPVEPSCMKLNLQLYNDRKLTGHAASASISI